MLNEFEPEKIGRGLYFAGNQKLGTYAYLGLPPPDPEAFLDQDVLWADSFAAIENAITEWGLKGVLLDSGAITQTRLFDFASGLRTHLREQGLLTLLALEWEQELDWAAAAEGGQI